VVLTVGFKPEVSYKVAVPVAALQIIEASATLTATVEATDKVQIPDGRASGRVRFLSLETSPITFPAGTVVATMNGVNYALTNNVTVPSVGASAGAVDAVVVADKPGVEGNLPGGIGSYMVRGAVRVQGLGAIAGGTVRSAQILSSADIARLRAQLEALANERAKPAIETSLPPGYRSFGNTETQLDFELPEQGAQGIAQTGRVVAHFRAKGYSPDSLIGKFAQPEVSDIMSDPEFRSLGDELTLTYARKVDPGSLMAVLEGWQGDKKQLLSLVAYLKSLPGVERVELPDLRNFRGLSLVIEVAR
jgi:hypothetical protein